MTSNIPFAGIIFKSFLKISKKYGCKVYVVLTYYSSEGKEGMVCYNKFDWLKNKKKLSFSKSTMSIKDIADAFSVLHLNLTQLFRNKILESVVGFYSMI